MRSNRLIRSNYWGLGYGVAVFGLWVFLALAEADGQGVDGSVLFAFFMLAALNAASYMVLVVLPTWFVLEHWPHSTLVSLLSKLFSIFTFVPLVWLFALSEARLEVVIAIVSTALFWVLGDRALRGKSSADAL